MVNTVDKKNRFKYIQIAWNGIPLILFHRKFSIKYIYAAAYYPD